MKLPRDWGYWTKVMVFIIAGLYLGHWLNGTPSLIDLRYWLHQVLTVKLNPRAAQPRFTAIVLVGDNEYWNTELQGRRPLNRNYLAKLLKEIDRKDPAVIALDFDLSAPDPLDLTGNKNDYYKGETLALKDMVETVRQNRPVVLPQTMGRDVFGRYVLEAAVHNDWGVCPLKPEPREKLEAREKSETEQNKDEKKVYCGYIVLPYDLRLLPPRTVLANGLELDSFALATAQARQPFLADPGKTIHLNYGSFIPQSKFSEDQLVVTANQLIENHPIANNLAHRVVLIGGDWHTQARGRGLKVDDHATPTGNIPGVFVHANYIEAILDGRAYPHVPEAVPITLEGGVALLAAWVLKRQMPGWRKIVINATLVVSFLVLSYLLFQNLGRFVDALFPFALVLGHFLVEQWQHLREEARHARAVKHGGSS